MRPQEGRINGDPIVQVLPIDPVFSNPKML
jgi:hypothetical protein